MQRSFAPVGAAVGLGLLVSGCGGGGAKLPTISGAGATFPAAAYQRWSQEYAAATGNQVKKKEH